MYVPCTEESAIMGPNRPVGMMSPLGFVIVESDKGTVKQSSVRVSPAATHMSGMLQMDVGMLPRNLIQLSLPSGPVKDRSNVDSNIGDSNRKRLTDHIITHCIIPFADQAHRQVLQADIQP